MSSLSTSTSSSKKATFHLGPIPYDDDLKVPSPPRRSPWEATATRMVRGVEGDINGNMEDESNNVTFAGKSPTRSRSMHLCMTVWNQQQGDVDCSRDSVRTPMSEGEVDCGIRRSSTVVMQKEDQMGPVEYPESQNTVKRSPTKLPPPGTLFHEVTFGQSLDSIALLYDTMPSYLLKLNKRTSRVVFAGEVILVPDNNNLDLLSPPDTITSKPKSAMDNIDDDAAKRTANKVDTSSFSNNRANPMDLTLRGPKTDASHLPMGEDKENTNGGMSVTDFIAEGWAGFRKKKTPTMERKVKRPRPLTRDESIQINKQCAENFLKIQVTQILPNKENIEGTLLITPNAVMFETQPMNEQIGKTHDPLDLIIPMRLISSASMFSDLSSFSLPTEKKGTIADSNQNSPTSPDAKAASSAAVTPTEPSHAKTENEAGSPQGESHPNSLPTQSALAKFFGAVEDWMLGSYGLLEIAPGNWMMIHQLPALLGFSGDSTGSPDAYSIDELPLYLRILLFDPITTVFKSKRDGARVRELKVTGPLQTQYWFKLPAEWVDKVYAFFVQWTPEESEGGRDEKNTFVMVSVDEGLDSGLANETFVHGSSAQPQTAAPSHSAPSEEGSESFEVEDEVSRTDTQLSDSFWAEQSMSRKYTKEWEILHHDEYSRRQRRLLEQTLPLPDIHGESLIMTVAHVRKMVPNLPSRCMGAHWCCLYNSTLDGLSINTLYRKCKSPPMDCGICCMLIIEPRENRRPNTPQSPQSQTSCPQSDNDSSSSSASSDEKVKGVQHNAAQQPQSNLSAECTKDLFGVVLSNPPACREGFYGNGQTFVFKFTKKPEKTSRGKRRLTETMNQASDETNKELDLWKLECFNWAGSNNLFISCGKDHITVGGDYYHAKPALLIDADLTRGQTFECQTFDSPKLTGNNESAFEISAIELWAFIPENCLDQMSIDFSGRAVDV